jgi:hypothetical protein
MRNENFYKLDDRDHFQQNAKTSVASLRGLIGSSRNLDRHQSGMLIAFIGIPKVLTELRKFRNGWPNREDNSRRPVVYLVQGRCSRG